MTSTETNTETSTAYTQADIRFELQNCFEFGDIKEIRFTGRNGDREVIARKKGYSGILVAGERFDGAKVAAKFIAGQLR